MRRFKTDMLIRNNRLVKMQSNGIQVEYEILSDESYITELKRKLIEESIECFNAQNSDELMHELADVMEVLEHLIDANDIDINKLSEVKQEKQTKVGKFNHKIKTHYIDIDENNIDELSYYLKYAEKYPEIKEK